MPTPERKPEYAHVGSLDGSELEYINSSRANTKRYGSYVVRAPPDSRRVGSHVPTRPNVAAHHRGKRILSKPQADDKRFAVLDPLPEESMHRILTQQDRLSGILTPTKVNSQPSPKASPSGSHIQRRSLSRFTKELERYCVAASASGKAPLALSTPTVSESPTTLDTVTEFLPYHKQFKAAGLAVTSREQMPRIPESAYPQLGNPRIGPVRGQIDGSTVTPSEHQSATDEPPGPSNPDQGQGGPPKPQPAAQASSYGSRTVAKSLLPWFRKKDAPTASGVHGERKFSKDHIHPSQATPAEPYMTPTDKLALIDEYFETPQPSQLQDEQPASRVALLSSLVSSSKSSSVHKPLPKQPPAQRRPVPPRSERRHMENTAEWPTTGVLIHVNTPAAPSHDETAAVFDDREATSEDDISSVHSWETEEDDLPDEPQRTPPVPPKEPHDTPSPLGEEKPKTPPKDDPQKELGPLVSRRQHPGHSLCNKWYKATGLRRRPVPTTIPEESKTTAEEDKKLTSGRPAPRHEPRSNKTPLHLPVSLPSRAESTSSFEKALDAIIAKLDAMEERRRYERVMELQATQKAPAIPLPSSKATSSKPLSVEPSSAPRSAPRSGPPASAVASEAGPASEDPGEITDKDIDARDILLGLKMAICAACDEDLDAWIRTKTGLRLRRFLADLKAFDSISSDRKASAPLPISRRIRRTGCENKGTQAERERKKRNPLKPPCFGADGQASLRDSSQES